VLIGCWWSCIHCERSWKTHILTCVGVTSLGTIYHHLFTLGWAIIQVFHYLSQSIQDHTYHTYRNRYENDISNQNMIYMSCSGTSFNNRLHCCIDIVKKLQIRLVMDVDIADRMIHVQLQMRFWPALVWFSLGTFTITYLHWGESKSHLKLDVYDALRNVYLLCIEIGRKTIYRIRIWYTCHVWVIVSTIGYNVASIL
jgi:hypothetical protein